jgi:hypothetical protein
VRDVSASFPAEIDADMASISPQVLGRLPEAMAVVQAAVDAGQTGDGMTDADPHWQPDLLGTLKRLLGVT